jgi:hypothetical protein
MVVTRNMIAFANIINADTLVDKIPLHEIVSTEAAFDLISTADGEIKLRRSFALRANCDDMQQAGSTTQVLRIQTLTNGHNAGREYCLRAESSRSCEDLISMIAHLSDAAKKERSAADSSLSRFHFKVKQVFTSEKFQAATAALIVLVCQPLLPNVVKQGK